MISAHSLCNGIGCRDMNTYLRFKFILTVEYFHLLEHLVLQFHSFDGRMNGIKFQLKSFPRLSLPMLGDMKLMLMCPRSSSEQNKGATGLTDAAVLQSEAKVQSLCNKEPFDLH